MRKVSISLSLKLTLVVVVVFSVIWLGKFAWKRLIAIYMFGMKYLEKKSFKREIGERTGLGYKLDLETYQLSAEDLRNNYLEITDELKR